MPIIDIRHSSSLLIYFILILNHFKPCSSLLEEERLLEYDARNYTFPPHTYSPDTPGWRSLMKRRMAQSVMVQDNRKKYNAWLNVMGSAVVVPNFTKYGWGLTRAPQDLIQELKESLYQGLEKEMRFEHKVEVLGDSPKAYFIDQDALNQKIMNQLKPMHEDWSNTTLVGSTVYGLRVYRNNSSLLMHTDKPNTHIISCILHVDHSADSEPWPIVIEDFTGATNEVYLESGDMLFYESSKCLHGRTRPFNGSWYSSVFVHYRPEEWDVQNQHLENHYAVPRGWSSDISKKEGLAALEIVGTGLKEPECKDYWCALQKSVKWYGPGKDGIIIDPGNVADSQTFPKDEF